MSDDLSVWLVAAPAAVHAGLAWMLGAAACCAWLRGAASGWAQRARRQARRALLVAVPATAALSAAGLWLQAADLTSLPLGQCGGAVLLLATGTHAGHAWLVGMLALGAIGAAATRVALPDGAEVAAGDRNLAVALLGAVVFVVTRSVVSHAGAQGDVSVDVAVDGLHLLSVCLWTGAVWMAAFGTLRHRPESAGQDDASRWVRQLSTTATAALAVLVLTGLYNTWRGVGSVAGLQGSAYGTALLVKLGLVAGAVALGGYNRFQVVPPLLDGQRADPAWHHPTLARALAVLRTESLLLAAALVAAGVLASRERPSQATARLPAASAVVSDPMPPHDGRTLAPL